MQPNPARLSVDSDDLNSSLCGIQSADSNFIRPIGRNDNGTEVRRNAGKGDLLRESNLHWLPTEHRTTRKEHTSLASSDSYRKVSAIAALIVTLFTGAYAAQEEKRDESNEYS
jgi:hypothetical protein